MKPIVLTLCVWTAALLGTHSVQAAETQADPSTRTLPAPTAEAVFAGGCFWCTESDFEKVEGVVDAVSGYTGGSTINPTYEQVSAGGTGHLEAVKVIYDPTRVGYAQLLQVFWRHVDPTDGGGQFVDRGTQYRSAIFYATDAERQAAEASKQALAAEKRFERPIVTEILPLGPFYPAETYHQDYYKKNPLRYRYYRAGSGRDQFLEKVWAGDRSHAMEKAAPEAAAVAAGYTRPTDEELRQRLTPLQYKVTRQDGTEPAFRNDYWDNHAAGIYVDVISGEPLFSSQDKYESGTGWPSFTRPLEPGNIVERQDRGFFTVRTEVRSRVADSHLGHVFPDGPAPTGLRYCMNSAALRFIPIAELEQQGYGRYLSRFE